MPFFIVSLLFALTFGATLGALTLASMTLPHPLLAGSWLTAAKIAHGHAQLFGFVALFIMGVAFHTMPRLRGAELAAPRAARATLWLLSFGVLAIAGSLASEGAEPSPLRLVAALSLFAGASLFTGVVHATLASGTAPRLPLTERFLRAGCLWLMIAAAMSLAGAFGGSDRVRAAMWEAALWGFSASWILGMGVRLLPAFLGLPLAAPAAAGWQFALYQAAVLAWVATGAASAWPLRLLAGSLLSLAVAVLLAQLGILRSSTAPPGRNPWGRRMGLAAFGWLSIATALAPAWTAVAALRDELPPPLVLDFARHAFTLGFLTQMIFAVTASIVPVMTGAPPWRRSRLAALFVLLNLAVITRSLQVVVAVTPATSVWPWISLSGVFGLSAFLVFSLEVISRRVSADSSAPALAPAAAGIGPDTLVAEVLERIPGALDVLIARGLRPLADPEVRAAVARTVTLRHASRMHAFDVDELVRALNVELATPRRAEPR